MYKGSVVQSFALAYFESKHWTALLLPIFLSYHSTTGDCHFYISREKVLSGAWMGVAFQTNSRFLAKANTL